MSTGAAPGAALRAARAVGRDRALIAASGHPLAVGRPGALTREAGAESWHSWAGKAGQHCGATTGRHQQVNAPSADCRSGAPGPVQVVSDELQPVEPAAGDEAEGAALGDELEREPDRALGGVVGKPEWEPDVTGVDENVGQRPSRSDQRRGERAGRVLSQGPARSATGCRAVCRATRSLARLRLPLERSVASRKGFLEGATAAARCAATVRMSHAAHRLGAASWLSLSPSRSSATARQSTAAASKTGGASTWRTVATQRRHVVNFIPAVPLVGPDSLVSALRRWTTPSRCSGSSGHPRAVSTWALGGAGWKECVDRCRRV